MGRLGLQAGREIHKTYYTPRCLRLPVLPSPMAPSIVDWSSWQGPGATGIRCSLVEGGGGFHPPLDTPRLGRRPPSNLLKDHPVELLVVDCGRLTKEPGRSTDPSYSWRRLVTPFAPTTVVESWGAPAALWHNGPTAKGTRELWKAQGFHTMCKLVDSSRVGGPMSQWRYLVLRRRGINQATPAPPEQGTSRPAANCLTPEGLVPRHLWRLRPPSHTRCHDPSTGPLPSPVHKGDKIWVQGPRGVRPLLPDEIARCLGAPGKEPIAHPLLLTETTSLYIWEYIGSWIRDPGYDPPKSTRLQLAPITHLTGVKGQPLDAPSAPFHWTPPDIRPGSPWHYRRINSLFRAARQYPTRFLALVNQGLDILRSHAGNYDRTGPRPTWLQVVWWEFPHEHWDHLREGSPMRFHSPPETGYHPNGHMDAEQLEVAREFVDELISLGVLRPRPPDMVIRTTTPLFVLEKPGQPGQWRVIADMKQGGQNSTAVGEPVYLNRPTHILERLYTGGWSAVVDASKFFYHFATHAADHPYLGVVHPVNGRAYFWHSLPMGSSNSPACACRHGMSFLRLLRRRLRRRGDTHTNTWRDGFLRGSLNGKVGYGFVEVDEHGNPAVLVWVHVDDFLLHAPTLHQINWALREFMAAALEVGLLCHPKKLVPPTQVAKYTGFLFDTRAIPTLRIPEDKRQRALAMIDFVLGTPHRLSTLGLTVLTGTLEALADATPSRIGHTYLRSLHQLIHDPPSDIPLDPTCTYYRWVALPPPCIRRSPLVAVSAHPGPLSTGAPHSHECFDPHLWGRKWHGHRGVN